MVHYLHPMVTVNICIKKFCWEKYDRQPGSFEYLHVGKFFLLVLISTMLVTLKDCV